MTQPLDGMLDEEVVEASELLKNTAWPRGVDSYIPDELKERDTDEHPRP
jgi:hypothetical protein